MYVSIVKLTSAVIRSGGLLKVRKKSRMPLTMPKRTSVIQRKGLRDRDRDPSTVPSLLMYTMVASSLLLLTLFLFYL